VKPVVVLVGPPGAGKTTVGRLAAQRLDKPFRDTDADIVALAGKPVAEIFIDDGEEHFRALERQAVADALSEHDGVLSLGGGAVLAQGTRQLLRGHTVALLSVGLSAATSRIGLNRDRPVLALNPRAQLKLLLDERMPLYREVATITVETDQRTAAQVVDVLLDALASRP